MPHILLAGTIATPPKSQPFPPSGRPRCETSIRVDGIEAELYPVIGFGSTIDELEVLKVGDVCSIVGEITQQTQKDDKTGKYVLVGLRVEVKQILPLARRSPNARPVQMAKNAYA